MGNQLLKGYNLQGQPISNAGNEKMWRIYQGHKQSTNVGATIFAIQKRTLPKTQKDQIIQYAKRQATSLARIRHPGVLAISQALIEDQHILAFSTEQVQGNLTLLAKQNRLKQILSNQIQLRLNLFPLIDTIQFLHENVKTVHLGLNFDNIYITKQGKWKLSGFSNSHTYGGQGLQDLKSFRCSNYYFCAPQIVNSNKFQKRSDVFSFGILILDLMLILTGKYEHKIYKTNADYVQNFESDLLKKMNCEALQKIQTYKELKQLLKSILARQPQKRASLHELSSSKWLNDKLVLTVRYLQNITNYDNKQQIQFLKGLLGILNNFQSKILTRKVLPLLLDLLKFKHLIPSVLYICIQIAKNGKIITQTDFKQKIWPSFRKVAQGKQMTAHSLYLFVQNMEKIQKIVGVQELSQYVIPLYIKCFDCPQKLKQLALHKTDYILSKMDYQFVKTKMIPKIMSCIKDQNIDVHKKSLIALRKSIKILDTQTVTSIVLPGLQSCKKSASDPFVNAITVSIYTMLGKGLPSQVLCSKLIPTILPYLSDPSVSPQDFYNYKNALTTMIQKIQSQRKKFWDEGQISQGPGFTEKDFQFQDQNKKNIANQPTIGKGDYNFLSNYNTKKSEEPEKINNNNENAQRTQNNQNDSQKQSIDFNFSSPWNFEQLKKGSSNNQNQPKYGFQMQKKQSNSQNPSHQNNFYGNSSMNMANTNHNNNMANNYNNFNTTFENKKPNYSANTQSLGNWGKSEPINQPISPETRQNFPKLKGPDNKMKKPQQPLDPWNIQLQDQSNNWNFPSQNNTNNTNNYNNNLNFQNTSYNTSPNSIQIANNNNYGNKASISNYLNTNTSHNNDPFAQIQSNTYGIGNSSSMNSNSYQNPTINNQNQYSVPFTNQNNMNNNGFNSFNTGLDFNNNSNMNNFNFNTNSMNKPNNQINQFSTFNTTNFDFDITSQNKQANTKNTGPNSFDLI